MFQPGTKICHRAPLSPFGHSLRVDPHVGEPAFSGALLTMLNRSTDCLCRRGAPGVELAP